jgi:hypothetical protein
MRNRNKQLLRMLQSRSTTQSYSGANMRTALALSCCLGAALFCFAGEKPKEYPLTLKIIRNETRTVELHSRETKTDCTSDSYGHTDCNSSASGASSALHSIQTAEVSDGNVYEIECQFSGIRGGLQGAANASGSVARYGCERIALDEFPARMDRRGLRIAFKDKNGHPKEQLFAIISVQPKPQGVEPKSQTQVAPEMGVIQLTCADSSAEIFVDGEFVGTGSANLKLAPGKHWIRIAKDGRKDWGEV